MHVCNKYKKKPICMHSTTFIVWTKYVEQVDLVDK